MESENICKFNFTRSSDLICLNFIKETKNTQCHDLQAKENAVFLVERGSGCFIRNGAEQKIGVGSLFFVCAADRFSVRSEDSLEYFYITFGGRRAEELCLRFGLASFGVFDEAACLLPFWKECHAAATEENIDILCESVLLYSLAKLPPSAKERVDAVSQIVSITQERFTERALSLPQIAKEIGYAPKYLSALFKKKKGISYTQYLRDLRLRHAVFLMERGVVSIKNIALLSGFGDALYFSKVFSDVMGISPKTYIKNLAEKE
jgi:AraC-like DNA-binding protein/mannose-6-phosphate isomerase-like protein (cupin superfamily)